MESVELSFWSRFLIKESKNLATSDENKLMNLHATITHRSYACGKPGVYAKSMVYTNSLFFKSLIREVPLSWHICYFSHEQIQYLHCGQNLSHFVFRIVWALHHNEEKPSTPSTRQHHAMGIGAYSSHHTGTCHWLGTHGHTSLQGPVFVQQTAHFFHVTW